MPYSKVDAIKLRMRGALLPYNLSTLLQSSMIMRAKMSFPITDQKAQLYTGYLLVPFTALLAQGLEGSAQGPIWVEFPGAYGRSLACQRQQQRERLPFLGRLLVLHDDLLCNFQLRIGALLRCVSRHLHASTIQDRLGQEILIKQTVAWPFCSMSSVACPGWTFGNQECRRHLCKSGIGLQEPGDRGCTCFIAPPHVSWLKGCSILRRTESHGSARFPKSASYRDSCAGSTHPVTFKSLSSSTEISAIREGTSCGTHSANILYIELEAKEVSLLHPLLPSRELHRRGKVAVKHQALQGLGICSLLADLQCLIEEQLLQAPAYVSMQ